MQILINLERVGTGFELLAIRQYFFEITDQLVVGDHQEQCR
ncbi:hypothetical protein ACFQGA_03835 [Marinobacter koreensis]